MCLDTSEQHAFSESWKGGMVKVTRKFKVQCLKL